MTQNCRGVRKPLQPERRKDKHPRPCISDPWGRHTHRHIGSVHPRRWISDPWARHTHICVCGCSLGGEGEEGKVRSGFRVMTVEDLVWPPSSAGKSLPSPLSHGKFLGSVHRVIIQETAERFKIPIT